MKRWTLLVSVLFLLVPALSVTAQAGDLLARINNLRASQGLPGYTMNGILSAAAQSQAQWMAETGVISHNRPDGSSPRSRALNAGYITADVSENIYGGTQASVDGAWNFWVNSDIHYRGMVNSRYAEVGIGIASGTVNTFVVIFGNPGGPAPGAPQIASSGGSGPAAPPSYVVGQDDFGNIMHEVQPGDTLGDIALIYGYTWDDLTYMRQLNHLEGNLLEVGSIFLVPPQSGTWTPVPGSEPIATAEAGQNEETAEVVAMVVTSTPIPSDTPQPSDTPFAISTAAAMPEVIVMALPTEDTPTSVAVVPTQVLLLSGTSGTITRSGTSPWLIVGLVVQVGVLLVAGVEFVRRTRRRR